MDPLVPETETFQYSLRFLEIGPGNANPVQVDILQEVQSDMLHPC